MGLADAFIKIYLRKEDYHSGYTTEKNLGKDQEF